ncbi:tetratricopeptide repeat protein 39B [Tetranychus urticae]|uniref:Tetratricopeptide repeat protein 39B n=1 Tax=Tetranychus urticae TaxID=32264 RepID=T1KGD7_TETUR|nr:tetratricopeptide repeat protein 39B [Tetranychus urticae]
MTIRQVDGTERGEIKEKIIDQPCESFDDEIFLDATDDGVTIKETQLIEEIQEEQPSLEQSMEEVTRVLELALSNQFEEAGQIADKWAEVSLYHALGAATLTFFKGVLTLEHAQIKNTMDSLKHVIDLYQIKKYQSNSVARVVWKPNYNNYTEDQIHAELVYAEAQLMIALMTFLQDQNLISLVKGALRIRSCFQTYKECNNILNQRVSWSSEKVKRHFESGVRMGLGTFNLMISHLPSKVLRLLEFVGFSGNRSIGFTELEASTAITDGLRSPLAKLIMMAYFCYIEHLFGLGNEDLTLVTNILSSAMEKYPNSAFFILFAGRINQLEGKLSEAILNFEKCIAIQNQWKQLHNICYWELLWCYTIRCNWKKAAEYADILRKECAWSPATYTYQTASYYYMSHEAEPDEKLRAQAFELFKQVPGLRIRYAGKTIPAEKFAITTSERFVSGEKRIIAPVLEFSYIWNIFAIMEKDKTLIDPMLKLIEKQLDSLKSEIDDSEKPLDDYLDLILMKGMCLRSMGFPYQAEQCFLEIIDNEKRLARDTYLAPHAAMELGLTYVRLNDLPAARRWLEKSRKDYTGYLLETMVHFRVHCAMRNIKIMEKQSASIPPLTLEEEETSSLDSTPSLPSEPLPLAEPIMPTGKGQSSFFELASKLQARFSFGFGASYDDSQVKL